MTATGAAAAESGSGVSGVDAWVTRYGPELRGHLTRMLGSEADAEDVLQQTWITAHTDPPRRGEDSNVRAWLYRVSTNAALDLLARRRRRNEALAAREPDATGEAGARPDEILDGLDPSVRRRVRDEVRALPRKQRDAVWLRWIEGEAYGVVAGRLECTVSAARANVYQGMKRLRERLGDLRHEEAER